MPSARRYAALIFDKDGTLTDFRATWAGPLDRALRRLAEGDPDRLRRLGAAAGFDPESGHFTPGGSFGTDTAEMTAARLAAELTDRDARQVHAALSVDLDGVPQTPAAPLRQVLAPLAERYRLALVTNDTAAEAARHLAAFGVADLFGFVAGADSGHGAKPGPGQIEAVLDHAGLEPAAALMIGDSRHDLDAAAAAGVDAVAVLTGAAPKAALAPHARAVLSDISHLQHWLDVYGSFDV